MQIMQEGKSSTLQKLETTTTENNIKTHSQISATPELVPI